ncbi:division/cell wall cluster transcriptional repressor MraZ [Sandaracinobacteroides saxicola]|uniref:Transcriptional regulator MraZ n=1 Tax=Sandaracinobacteroides saxicola TaxID=2759707 RepID=A0A7G5IG91_9SPHN|nr:hypothetical protein [Sandaracinobacteroides saxicola]QMW22383.1 hypothetical protein H3309_13675 [Sandaracinobacteroides saxicola]
MNRTIFSGSCINGIDAKHRLSVPAGLREALESRSGEKALALTPDEHRPCLVGYDVRHFEAQVDTLNNRFEGDFSSAPANRARETFALAEVLRYDDTGRLSLTPLLRDLAELTHRSAALFLGLGDRFELWAPETFLALPDLSPRLERTVRSLMAARA